MLLQNFSENTFVPWKVLIGIKQSHGNTAVSILLFLRIFPKSGVHFSIALRL